MPGAASPDALDRAGPSDLAERVVNRNNPVVRDDAREQDCHGVAVLAAAGVDGDERAGADHFPAFGRYHEIRETRIGIPCDGDVGHVGASRAEAPGVRLRPPGSDRSTPAAASRWHRAGTWRADRSKSHPGYHRAADATAGIPKAGNPCYFYDACGPAVGRAERQRTAVMDVGLKRAGFDAMTVAARDERGPYRKINECVGLTSRSQPARCGPRVCGKKVVEADRIDLGKRRRGDAGY